MSVLSSCQPVRGDSEILREQMRHGVHKLEICPIEMSISQSVKYMAIAINIKHVICHKKSVCILESQIMGAFHFLSVFKITTKVGCNVLGNVNVVRYI